MILIRSEAQCLLERINDGRAPNDPSSGFWGVMRDYGNWTKQDLESVRLNRCCQSPNNERCSTWNITDDQALFIDQVILNARKECEENAYQAFIFCFLTSGRDTDAIAHFNRQLCRRARAHKIKPDEQYRAELKTAAGLVFNCLNCELHHILNSKKPHKSMC